MKRISVGLEVYPSSKTHRHLLNWGREDLYLRTRVEELRNAVKALGLGNMGQDAGGLQAFLLSAVATVADPPAVRAGPGRQLHNLLHLFPIPAKVQKASATYPLIV
jgi:hypothetical protein